LPPRRVFWGQRSGDEMGDLWIQVLTRNDADLETLTLEFEQKVMAEDVIGYERWIQSEPKSSSLHDDVGTLYLKLNRPNDAVRHFAISASMKPSAQASFNLATALTVAGQPVAAIAQFERALGQRPDYAQAHTNLGSVLLQQGNAARALEHLNEALRIDPASPQAHFSAAMAHETLGRYDATVSHLTRALQSQPDFAEAMAQLAWILAVAPDDRVRDVSRGVAMGERAVALKKRHDASALDALAAAYAAAGQFDRAVTVVGEALALNPTNAADISARRELYRNRQPFRIPLK
jgi:tetratricopeptide (TPR) repeat protein